MRVTWGNLLMAKRFGEKKEVKKKVERDSVTEYGRINKLAERLDMAAERADQGREVDNADRAQEMSEELLPMLDLTMSMPPRVPYSNMDRELYSEIEARVFNRWKRMQKTEVFERNLEVWRQFWITCERADVIAQIVDSRNPAFFFNDDIRRTYPNKKHILLSNKADLAYEQREFEGYEVIYYSALRDKALVDYIVGFRDKAIGFIGYPNVGKSSTINLIVGQKKVKVSETPGKTKYIQTIPLRSDLVLLDCPGLVFARHSKIDLLLHGILNVDQLLDLSHSLDYIVEFIGIRKLCEHYGVRGFCNGPRHTTGHSFIEAMSASKGWVRGKCLKAIVRDFASGCIRHG
jgi:large subunit GTPase 1